MEFALVEVEAEDILLVASCNQLVLQMEGKQVLVMTTSEKIFGEMEYHQHHDGHR